MQTLGFRGLGVYRRESAWKGLENEYRDCKDSGGFLRDPKVAMRDYAFDISSLVLMIFMLKRGCCVKK